MSDDKEAGTCFICSFLSGVKLKIKVVVAAMIALAGLIFMVRARSGRNFKKMLEYELKKVRSEIEIEKAKEEVSLNNGKISELQRQEEAIRGKILELDAASNEGREVSAEELDEFFDKRGF
jgi:hypothetical protein